MNKSKKIHLAFFLSFVAICICPVYYVGTDFLSKQEKPWHLQPAVHEDSLSLEYKNSFPVLKSKRVIDQIDSSSSRLIILVEGWGVPRDISVLKRMFGQVEGKYYLHTRLANRTEHAEKVEYRHADEGGIFFFGGDSLEYNRKGYIQELGFREEIFCQKCADSLMLEKIDSVMAEGVNNLYAWTSQDFRLGEKEKLEWLLKGVVALAKKYPDLQVVVMGTHRPTLGDASERRMYFSHWVPVVVIN